MKQTEDEPWQNVKGLAAFPAEPHFEVSSFDMFRPTSFAIDHHHTILAR